MLPEDLRTLKIQFSAFLVALAAVATAQLDPNRVIVVINGEEIKAAEYYRRMEFLPGVGKQVGGRSFAQAPPGLLTIDQLITERLVFQQAKAKGVYPTDAEVKDEIEFNTKMDSNYVKGWVEHGRTVEELEYATRYNLAQFKLVSQGITFTDAQVKKFYDDNIAIFTVPKMVTLRVIAVGSEALAKEVDADLAAGKSFAEVAKAKSIDVTAALNGEFGKRPYDQLSKVVQKELDKIKIGQATAWIIDDENNMRIKFELVAAEAAYPKPLDDVLKRRIRRDQMAVLGGVRNDIRKQMTDARREAKIDIKEKEFSDNYKKFMETFVGSGG